MKIEIERGSDGETRFYRINEATGERYQRAVARLTDRDMDKLKELAKKNKAWWDLATMDFISPDIREFIDVCVRYGVQNTKIKEMI